MLKKFHATIRTLSKRLQKYIDRWWYTPLLGVLAILDVLFVVIPTDGLLISSSVITPKHWLKMALIVSVGSTIGAVILASLIESQGLPWILELFPGIQQTPTWNWSMQFFEKYGLFLVFLIAATPLMQQPSVIIASMAHTPLFKLALIIFAGRLVKNLVMAFIASKAPHLLSRIWGLKGEMEDVGLESKN